MRKTTSFLVTMGIVLVIAFLGYRCNSHTDTKEPVADTTSSNQSGAFQNHRDSVPSQQQYDAPLFVLSHDYPQTFTPVVNPSWDKALGGQPISQGNYLAYMDSLKAYVAPRVIPFFLNNKQWTAAKYGWFQEPWMGSQREAILGAYLGNGNPAGMFKTLKEDEAGYALVLYDSTAGYTVGQIWGATGQKVNLINNATQFPEGSIVVKLAFSNVNFPDWPVLEGAQTFNVYDTIPTKANPATGYQMRQVSFFQMDVIVKDSSASPKTGWVYSTFVYDMRAKGDFWKKMVPLGAMWGDDPNVNSPVAPPYPALSETAIDTAAPPYSTETLGWGGRLSGPNDGAVAQDAVDIGNGKKYKNLALSSCMSCHSPAQDTFKSFLLPGPFPVSNTLYVYTPGSPRWNLWFRDNWGNVPFDSGQVAMDYDMVMAFKSVPAYEAAQPSGQNQVLKANVQAVNNFRRHNTHSQFWH